MSVQSSDWSLQQDSPIFRKPDPPISSDSHSGHQLMEYYVDTSGQASTDSSLGPPCLDINQASNWPEFRILLQQLPPQDSDEHYCLALGEDELAQLRLFCAQRKQKSLGQGVARLLPPKLEGHTCEKACGQALINLIYFYHDGHLYCGRHHAELLRPRCPACDQLIFSQRCTEAEGRRWHENHFCCQDCAGPLGAGPYALPGGSPCCPSCFESRYQSVGSNSEGAPEGHASLGKGGDGADRASLACALRRPPEPTRRGCGDRLAPGRGTRSPTGGRRRGPLGETRGSGGAHGTAWGGAGGCTQPWPASCTGIWGLTRAFLTGLEQGEQDPIQASAGTVPARMTRSSSEMRFSLQSPAPPWDPRARRPKGRTKTAHRRPETPKRTASAPPAPLPPSRNPKGFSSASAFQVPGRPPKTSRQMRETSPGSTAPFVSSAARRSRW